MNYTLSTASLFIRKILSFCVVLSIFLACSKDEGKIEYLEFSPEMIIGSDIIPVNKTAILTINLNNKLISSEQAFTLIYTPQIKTAATLKIGKDLLKDREEYKFISKTSNDVIQIEIMSTQEGYLPFELAITAGGKISKILTKTLTFVEPDKTLTFEVLEYPTPQLNKETPLNVKIGRDKYTGEFITTYNLLKGAGKLFTTIAGEKTEITPNSTITFKNNVINNLEYTPSMYGEHVLVLSINNDGDVVQKQIPLNVPVHVTALVSLEGAGTVTGGGEYPLDGEVTLTAKKNIGYTFLGFYAGEKLLSQDLTYTFTAIEDISITANFEKTLYVINTSCEPEVAGEIIIKGAVDVGKEITLTATNKKGYLFSHFDIDGSLYPANPFSFVMPDKDLSVKGIFNPVQTTILFTAGAGGTVSNPGGKYNYNETITSIAQPSANMRFIGWYKNSNLYSSSPELKVLVDLEDQIFEARFESNERQIIVVADNPTLGTVSGGGIFQYGNNVTITASPIEHHHLVGWYESGSLTTTENPYTFTVEKDRQFNARFERDIHTITTVPGKGYLITPTRTVLGGDNCIINLTIENDYKFMSFQGESYPVKEDKISFVNVSRDYTIHPIVRYNIINIWISGKENMITVHSSIPTPCNLTVSVLTQYGPVSIILPEGSVEKISDTEYIPGLADHGMYKIEYTSGTNLQGYEIRY